jgi:putative hydrolase of the HAD superfamily
MGVFAILQLRTLPAKAQMTLMEADNQITGIDLIAFDADDTLWQNEDLFYATHERFKKLLVRYHDEQWIVDRLYQTESRNFSHFGYGVKGFTLSMIETAIELSEGRISAGEIQAIIELGREMMNAPIQLLDGVAEVIEQLSQKFELMLITKGDLFHQESKIVRSGLKDYFKRVEIVSEKDAEVYQRIAAKHGITPERFLMIGNSLRSDILPVIAMGGIAVHVPYKTEWVHERVSPEELIDKNYFEVQHFNLLPDFLSRFLK